ncbi:MAG: ribosomal protein S19 family protein [Candidatus Micrarchaeota archaeon]
MARKELFRGYEEEQMRDMAVENFLPLLTSRERRTLKRINQNPAYKKLVDKVRKLKKEGKLSKPVKTQVREAVILPEWLGLRFAVHNGKEYKPVQITLHSLGKRLGDFAHSSYRVLHSGPGVGATRGSKFVPLK